MNHDQLARVFPDGRTVHVPSDGKAAEGYELALADVEKRGSGDDAASKSKPGLLASLFRGKSNDEDDEGAAAVISKPSPVGLMAAAVPPNPPSRCRRRRSKPQVAATFQLASADAAIVPSPKAKQAAAVEKPAATAEKPNRNRKRRPTSSMPAASGAMPRRRRSRPLPRRWPPSTPARRSPPPTRNPPPAFPARSRRWPTRRQPHSPVDRANVVAASAPDPAERPAGAQSSCATTIDTVVAKGSQGQGSVISTSTRIAAAKGNDIWMRAMILAPSASTSMSATVLGDADMTILRAYFVKPRRSSP